MWEPGRANVFDGGFKSHFIVKCLYLNPLRMSGKKTLNQDDNSAVKRIALESTYEGKGLKNSIIIMYENCPS